MPAISRLYLYEHTARARAHARTHTHAHARTRFYFISFFICTFLCFCCVQHYLRVLLFCISLHFCITIILSRHTHLYYLQLVFCTICIYSSTLEDTRLLHLKMKKSKEFTIKSYKISLENKR